VPSFDRLTEQKAAREQLLEPLAGNDWLARSEQFDSI